MRKDTGLLSNAILRRTTVTCNGKHDHTTLEGPDPKTGLPLSVLTSTYPRRLAKAFAQDVRQHLERSPLYIKAERADLALLASAVTIYWHQVQGWRQERLRAHSRAWRLQI